MEFVKKSDTGADIFEDYAHHPTEIRATISSLTQMGYKRILCVFQSHTYSRTYYLYREFCSAFANVSQLILYPVFSAREENIFELTEEKFATDCGGEFLSDIDKIVHRVKETDCDCVVLMGAGDLPGKIKGKL
jgi:UDP-N-acetylmuramate--alanine ligase